MRRVVLLRKKQKSAGSPVVVGGHGRIKTEYLGTRAYQSCAYLEGGVMPREEGRDDLLIEESP